MADMKSAALAYASDGVPVFPTHSWTKDGCSCGTNCSSPAKHPRVPGGHKSATTNRKQIEEWWSLWPDANVATCPGDTDRMVVDVDPGGTDEPYPDTDMWANTPRGGCHLWYTVSRDTHIPNSASKLADHVDVRGHDGYVLLPPSATKDGSYTWDDDGKAQTAPAWLVEKAQQGGLKERKKDAAVWRIEPDQPEHIGKAREAAAGNGPLALYPAVEGKAGDQATFDAACMMRSFGLSEATAVDVLHDIYNPRCQPPWDYEDLQVKVANAYRYATSAPGNCTDEYQRLKRREDVEIFQSVSTLR